MDNTEKALTQMTDAEIEFICRNTDTRGMSMEDKRALASVLLQDRVISNQGFDFRPQRYKINKDNQTFVEPLGTVLDEIKGVILHKQRVRALWDEGSNIPLCSSLDCITGIDSEGMQRPCDGCEYDEWGSASDEKSERKGKACKEMRRIYLIEKNGTLPIIVTLSPTSIKPWDEFNSARSTAGITDLSAEVTLRLTPGKSGSYTYSVIQPKIGPKLAPADIVKFFKMRQKFAESWAKAEITNEDYETTPEEDIPID